MCEGRALADGSKEGSPASKKGSDSSSDDSDGEMEKEAGLTGNKEVVGKLSEYEIRRAQNIAENKARLEEVDAQLQVKYDLPETTPFVQSKAKQSKTRAGKPKNSGVKDTSARRRSSRQSGYASFNHSRCPTETF